MRRTFPKKFAVAVEQVVLAAGTTVATKRDRRMRLIAGDLVRFDTACADPVALGRTERSIGVAEHHAYTGLTRLNLTRFLVGCVHRRARSPAGRAGARVDTATRSPPPAGRSTSAAQRWFAAQADAARIDATIADVEHQIADAQASMATRPQARDRTRGRHVQERRRRPDVDLRRQRARLGASRSPRRRRERRRRRRDRTAHGGRRQPEGGAPQPRSGPLATAEASCATSRPSAIRSTRSSPATGPKPATTRPSPSAAARDRVAAGPGRRARALVRAGEVHERARPSDRDRRRSPPPAPCRRHLARERRPRAAPITTIRSSCAHVPARATGNYDVGQSVRLLRRVPVPAVDLGLHRRTRGPARPRRCAPVARVAVRPGRDRVGAVPVAGQRPVGRTLLTNGPG